jgi:hypothetical protein
MGFDTPHEIQILADELTSQMGTDKLKVNVGCPYGTNMAGTMAHYHHSSTDICLHRLNFFAGRSDDQKRGTLIHEICHHLTKDEHGHGPLWEDLTSLWGMRFCVKEDLFVGHHAPTSPTMGVVRGLVRRYIAGVHCGRGEHVYVRIDGKRYERCGKCGSTRTVGVA